MICKYFGICGSCKFYEQSYKEQLILKKEKILKDFLFIHTSELDVKKSKDSHFRSRAEFRIWHEGDDINYAMHKLDKKGIVTIDSCLIVSEQIYALMPKLIDKIKKDELLKIKLFAVEFLSSTSGEILTTLIYHKKIDEIWKEKAQNLSEVLNIKIIGRSRKVKITVGDDFIHETLTINDKKYFYKLYENSFTQPNSDVNQQMIGWVKDNLGVVSGDLLELYCGHGNFTIPLSENFNQVLATEISKTSIKAALENCELNSVENIHFVRLSSEELTSALKKKREFNRLKDIDLDDFAFEYVFVDPPRAGLDEKSLNFIKKFPNIIYISCNPQTLKRDLELLTEDFKVKNFAIFDQFPYTEHIESGVILHRK